MNESAESQQQVQQDLQWRQTIQAIEAFKKEKFDNLLEHQSISELLFEILGGEWWTDNLPAFEQASVALLSFLLHPDVAPLFQKQFHKTEQKEVAQLLRSLNSFFRQLRDEFYELELLLVELKRNETEELSTLALLEGEYKVKREVYLLERSRIEQLKKEAWARELE